MTTGCVAVCHSKWGIVRARVRSWSRQFDGLRAHQVVKRAVTTLPPKPGPTTTRCRRRSCPLTCGDPADDPAYLARLRDQPAAGVPQRGVVHAPVP